MTTVKSSTAKSIPMPVTYWLLLLMLLLLMLLLLLPMLLLLLPMLVLLLPMLLLLLLLLLLLVLLLLLLLLLLLMMVLMVLAAVPSAPRKRRLRVCTDVVCTCVHSPSRMRGSAAKVAAASKNRLRAEGKEGEAMEDVVRDRGAHCPARAAGLGRAAGLRPAQQRVA